MGSKPSPPKALTYGRTPGMLRADGLGRARYDAAKNDFIVTPQNQTRLYDGPATEVRGRWLKDINNLPTLSTMDQYGREAEQIYRSAAQPAFESQLNRSRGDLLARLGNMGTSSYGQLQALSQSRKDAEARAGFERQVYDARLAGIEAALNNRANMVNQLGGLLGQYQTLDAMRYGPYQQLANTYFGGVVPFSQNQNQAMQNWSNSRSQGGNMSWIQPAATLAGAVAGTAIAPGPGTIKGASIGSAAGGAVGSAMGGNPTDITQYGGTSAAKAFGGF